MSLRPRRIVFQIVARNQHRGRRGQRSRSHLGSQYRRDRGRRGYHGRRGGRGRRCRDQDR
ncbi:hypothetical protein HOLleu_27576 [Holothuria leucospilota]|uniref:Uncharacterized protein n=1 Tax=Holothuria leucospilota TaxID=206669 RepID=A0A9Q1BQZ0_HOLLE|nr:hypothetical protein HOLleu_27576 [Holothuria leucospilota]